MDDTKKPEPEQEALKDEEDAPSGNKKQGRLMRPDDSATKSDRTGTSSSGILSSGDSLGVLYDSDDEIEDYTTVDDWGLDDDDDVVVDGLAEQLETIRLREELLQDSKTKQRADDSEALETLGTGHDMDDYDVPGPVLQLANWIEKECRNILVVSGAGVSVAAGIPDFRSPGTGLYDNLQKYNLPYPEAVFDIHFYRTNPQPFVSLAKEIWPGITHKPTKVHSFLKLLSDRGWLLRNYSQNIDGLEFLANIPPDHLVECHGHFRSASCVACHRPVTDMVAVQNSIVVDGQPPVCVHCGAYVKPDIVFFGEGLPSRFHTLLKEDVAKADLCLVLGTSLKVAPVSMIPEMVQCKKRVLLNLEPVGEFTGPDDLFIQGDCEVSIVQLAQALGWKEELLEANRSAQDAVGGS